MPATATVANKPAAASPKSEPSRSPAKKAPGPQPAQPLPSFARSALDPPRKLTPLASHGEGTASGAPLAPHVQQAIEGSLGVDLGSVRLHSDSAAQDKAKSFSARAFTFGSHIFLGQGERASDVGLIAHEAAHVVQQQSTPAIHAWSNDRGDRFEREADHASSAVQRGESFTVRERVATPKVQRLGISDALDYFADAAYNIPGYRMFTIVIGVNPINMESADRSPGNILRAVVEFMPGGKQITDALAKHGVFEKAGKWISDQLATLAITGAAIKKALMDFLDSLSWRDIFHLGRVWDRAVRIFTEPIDRILDFLAGLVEGIWTLIREAILKPISSLAAKLVPGWTLLLAVLGFNPITGESVAAGEDVIGEFMKLIHEEEIWENIKRANAIPRAWKWFKNALSGLVSLVTSIPSLFVDALKSLSWSDILDLPGAFMKIAKPFAKFFVSFVTWAGTTIWDLLQIIFEVVAPGLIPYLKKLGASFKEILKHPIPFVKNLVAAGKLGLHQFVARFGQHLKDSFFGWLTGNLPGVYIPKSFDLSEIVKFVLSVLGLTWQNIRGKLVKAVGETAVKAMETGFDIVVTLVREGPAAAWEKIKDEISNLKEMAINAIMNYVIETIVKTAIEKLVSMLIPGGAFIQAIISIYDTIMFFVEKLSKIIQVVKAFLDSLMEIVAGAIGGAANKVEDALSGALTVAIGFLANFLKLGKIADKVMEIINKIRDPIDKALDRVVAWIMAMGAKLWKGAKGAAQKVVAWWNARQPFQGSDGSSHTLLFVGEGENAQLAFESTTTTLQPFLSTITKTPGNQALVDSIQADITLINTVRTVNKPGAPPLSDATIDANKATVAAALLRISVSLGKLVGTAGWGTSAKPLPINYPKPQASNYKVLYFGPKTEVAVPQTDLEAAYPGGLAKASPIITLIKGDKPGLDRWAKRGYPIERFVPAVSGQAPLPEGGSSIGVTSDYQTKTGMKLILKPGNTAGGAKITRALRPYGYRNAIESTDGDHVVEMQLGGPNELENLWPLNSGVNQNSGRTIATMAVPKPDGTTIKMPDLKEEARKREVWVVIAQTEG